MEEYQSIAPMNTERAGAAGVSVNDHQFLVVGGHMMSSCEFYDANTETWSNKIVANLPEERAYCGLVCVGQKVFCLGGEDRTSSWRSDLLCLDLSSCGGDLSQAVGVQWDSSGLAPMRQARSRFACVSDHCRYIYVFGGVFKGADGGYQILDTAEKYDTYTNQWTPLPKIPAGARQGCGAVRIGHTIYLVGNMGSASTAVFDTHGEEWSSIDVPEMKSARFALSVVVAHGSIYAIGGWDGTQQLPSIEVLDTQTNSWSEVPAGTLKIGTSDHVAGFLPAANSIIVAGGIDNDRKVTNAAGSFLLTTPPPKDPYIIQGQQNLDDIKGNLQMNDALASIYTEKGHKAAEAILVDGSWISDIYLPNGCPEGSKLTIRCNSTWNIKVHNLKPYSKTVATKQRLVVVVVGCVWTIQEWVDEKGPYIVKGQGNLNRFKGTGGNYFLIVAGGRVVLHSADLEECKKHLMTKYGHGASSPSRMIVDVSGGKVHEDPHSVGGQNQGGGMSAGFNKWWQDWPDIHSMTAVAKTYMNTHKLGGPPKNDNLLHIFNPKDYKDCEIHTWDGSWIPDIYLPDAKGILDESTLTIKCNSTWSVKVHYHGKWTKTLATKQQLILTVKNKVWVVKTA